MQEPQKTSEPKGAPASTGDPIVGKHAYDAYVQDRSTFLIVPIQLVCRCAPSTARDAPPRSSGTHRAMLHFVPGGRRSTTNRFGRIRADNGPIPANCSGWQPCQLWNASMSERIASAAADPQRIERSTESRMEERRHHLLARSLRGGQGGVGNTRARGDSHVSA